MIPGIELRSPDLIIARTFTNRDMVLVCSFVLFSFSVYVFMIKVPVYMVTWMYMVTWVRAKTFRKAQG